MKVALNSTYWTDGPPRAITTVLREAEAIGYDSLWTAEAYGSDSLTPIAYYAAHTKRMRLGTAVTQIPARTPASTAMTAMTLDHLSQGRFILGLGPSGPQVSEGWYGRPYHRPLAGTREYVEIVRAVMARDKPVSFEGEHYRLPADGGTGLGKPLRSSLRPFRPDLPIYLGAEGPKNVEQTAAIADGWLAYFFSPKQNAFYREHLAAGFARRAGGRPTAFETVAVVPVVLDDDVDAAADTIRPMLALYIGGMGAKGANFHADVFRRMGYEQETDAVQDAYLSGHRSQAAQHVTNAMVEDIALIGPADKITDDIQRWKSTLIDVLAVETIPSNPRDLATIASIVAD